MKETEFLDSEAVEALAKYLNRSSRIHGLTVVGLIFSGLGLYLVGFIYALGHIGV